MKLLYLNPLNYQKKLYKSKNKFKFKNEKLFFFFHNKCLNISKSF